MGLRASFAPASAIVVCAFLFTECNRSTAKPGTVLDEARQVSRTPESFPAADEDYFHDMDGAISLIRTK